MSKISDDAARAFYEQRYFKRSNTLVSTSRVGNLRVLSSALILFGNKIAEFFWYEDVGIADLYITTAQWDTVTTKSRLNAILSSLGKSIFTKDGELFIYDSVDETTAAWGGERINIYRGERITP